MKGINPQDEVLSPFEFRTAVEIQMRSMMRYGAADGAVEQFEHWYELKIPYEMFDKRLAIAVVYTLNLMSP